MTKVYIRICSNVLQHFIYLVATVFCSARHGTSDNTVYSRQVKRLSVF